jgi:MYXO-CTERM domain-containing protein
MGFSIKRIKIRSCQSRRFPIFISFMKLKHCCLSVLPSAFLFLAIASPSSVAAVTQFTFLNGMSGANESPANASTAIGTINTLQFDDSVGTFGTLSINVTFSGLSSTASASHLHGFSNATTNAGVIAVLTVTAATSGTITGSWAPASALQVSQLFSGLTYINLHTSTFPGGEIRGQLVPVPEPGVFGLLGVTGLALLRRRRA